MLGKNFDIDFCSHFIDYRYHLVFDLMVLYVLQKFERIQVRDSIIFGNLIHFINC